MGVKSTVVISRDDAAARLADMYTNQTSDIIRITVGQMSDKAIENELERLNDLRCGGEGFENYRIY